MYSVKAVPICQHRKHQFAVECHIEREVHQRASSHCFIDDAKQDRRPSTSVTELCYRHEQRLIQLKRIFCSDRRRTLVDVKSTISNGKSV
jgi:hypothetical protein